MACSHSVTGRGSGVVSIIANNLGYLAQEKLYNIKSNIRTKRQQMKIIRTIAILNLKFDQPQQLQQRPT